MATKNSSTLVNQLVVGATTERREPVVTELERQSPLWIKIVKHLEGRIDVLRAKNDRDKNTEATAKLRGRIAEAKNLLALDKPAPATDADDSD